MNRACRHISNKLVFHFNCVVIMLIINWLETCSLRIVPLHIVTLCSLVDEYHVSLIP
jgi:hypothetical protein